MHAEISWIGGRGFSGKSGSGHSVVMDGPADKGGNNLGVRPMEMLLLGLGGCTSFDVVDILEKGRQQIDECVVAISAERSSAVPAVFEHIHLHYRLRGQGLSAEKVERAIDLSMKKYCSASIMMERAGVVISHDYELLT